MLQKESAWNRLSTLTFAGLPIRIVCGYALLFTVAFSLYSTIWQNAPILVADSGGYLRAAQQLANFELNELQERAPGYPLLLLLTASSETPTRALFFVSLLLHFTSIWLLSTILHEIGLSESVLLLFAGILLLPPYVEPAAYVLSENLSAFMLVGGFTGCVYWIWSGKRRWLVLSSLAIGYSGITRPTYQILFLVLIFYLIVSFIYLRSSPIKFKDILKGSSIIALISIILIGGYSMMNYLRFDYFGISPKLGLTLSTKTMRVLDRLPDEDSLIREVLIRARDVELVQSSSHIGYMYIWRALPELLEITGLQYPELSKFMLQRNLRLIRDAPLEYLREVAWAFVTYWFPSATVLANMNSRLPQLLWSLIHSGIIASFFTTLLMLSSSVLLLLTLQHLHAPKDNIPSTDTSFFHLQGFVYALAGTIVLYTAFISCVIEVGDPRFRVPTDSLIIFMVFLGVHVWKQFLTSTQIVFRHPSGDVA